MKRSSASAFVRWRVVIADLPRPERRVRVRGMPHRWPVTARRRQSARRAARRTSTARQRRRPTPGWRAERYMTYRYRRWGQRSSAHLHRLEAGRLYNVGRGRFAQKCLPQALLSKNACRHLTSSYAACLSCGENANAARNLRDKPTQQSGVTRVIRCTPAPATFANGEITVLILQSTRSITIAEMRAGS